MDPIETHLDIRPQGLQESTQVRLMQLLAEQRATASTDQQLRFATRLAISVQARVVVQKAWHTVSDPEDIVSWIRKSCELGDSDEAIWGAYLAAHFGRPSARTQPQIHSAGRLLCAWGARPFWTWNRCAQNPMALHDWLVESHESLESLRFGRHRKYESSKPQALFRSLESFIKLCTELGGPHKLLTEGAGEKEIDFESAYQRLARIDRFGRTARFDFLLLLNDLNVFRSQPDSCYLSGSTGPRSGAAALWGERSPRRLDELACQMVRELGLPAAAVEDALCNWQK